MRTEMRVPDATVIPLLIKNPGILETTCIDVHAELIKRIARLETLEISDDGVPKGAAQAVLGTTTLVFPLISNVNVDEEKTRLEKEIFRLGGEIERIDNKLSNKSFVEKAPKKVVEEEKVKRDDYERSRSKVQEALDGFS